MANKIASTGQLHAVVLLCEAEPAKPRIRLKVRIGNAIVGHRQRVAEDERTAARGKRAELPDFPSLGASHALIVEALRKGEPSSAISLLPRWDASLDSAGRGSSHRRRVAGPAAAQDCRPAKRARLVSAPPSSVLPRCASPPELSLAVPVAACGVPPACPAAAGPALLRISPASVPAPCMEAPAAATSCPKQPPAAPRQSAPAAPPVGSALGRSMAAAVNAAVTVARADPASTCGRDSGTSVTAPPQHPLASSRACSAAAAAPAAAACPPAAQEDSAKRPRLAVAVATKGEAHVQASLQAGQSSSEQAATTVLHLAGAPSADTETSRPPAAPESRRSRGWAGEGVPPAAPCSTSHASVATAAPVGASRAVLTAPAAQQQQQPPASAAGPVPAPEEHARAPPASTSGRSSEEQAGRAQELPARHGGYAVCVQAGHSHPLLPLSLLAWDGRTHQGAAFPACSPAELQMRPPPTRVPASEVAVTEMVSRGTALKHDGDKALRRDGQWVAASLCCYPEAALKYMEACELMLRLPRSAETASRVAVLYSQTANLLSCAAESTARARGSRLAREALRILCERLCAVCCLRQSLAAGPARNQEQAEQVAAMAARQAELLQKGSTPLCVDGTASQLSPDDSMNSTQDVGCAPLSTSGGAAPAASTAAPISGASVVEILQRLSAAQLSAARQASRFARLMRRSVIALQTFAERADVRESAAARGACVHMAAVSMDAGLGEDARSVAAHAHAAILHIRRLG